MNQRENEKLLILYIHLRERLFKFYLNSQVE
jgi:hypothetical protein